jgi:hypothetical protein
MVKPSSCTLLINAIVLMSAGKTIIMYTLNPCHSTGVSWKNYHHVHSESVLWHGLRMYMMIVFPADISIMVLINSVHDDGFSSWHQYHDVWLEKLSSCTLLIHAIVLVSAGKTIIMYTINQCHSTDGLRMYMMIVFPADISIMVLINSVHDDGFSSWHQYYGID